MIDETLSELLVSITQETTQEKIISIIKENTNITQGWLSVRLGVIRDVVSYSIENFKLFWYYHSLNIWRRQKDAEEKRNFERVCY